MGPEHYREAERLVAVDDIHEGPTSGNIALAHVHATLALAAATAMTAYGRGGAMHAGDFTAWDDVCGVHSGGTDA